MATTKGKVKGIDMAYHAVLFVVLAAAASLAVFVGPSVSSVVGFFWPLLVSTAFFLASVAVLLRISPPPPSSPEDGAELPGEELMDYVAGHPLQDDTAAAAEAEGPAPEPKEGKEEGEADQNKLE